MNEVEAKRKWVVFKLERKLFEKTLRKVDPNVSSKQYYAYFNANWKRRNDV